MPQLRFPSNLNPNVHAAIRFTPVDLYTAAPVDSTSILLFCPTNISFTDSGNYSEFSLGFLSEQQANLASDMAKSFQGSKEGSLDAISRTAQNMFSTIADETKEIFGVGAAGLKEVSGDPDLMGFLAASAYARHRGNQDLEEAISFKTRKAVNPRTNMAFKGVSIRSYSFSFKLVPSSQVEQATVKNIDAFFRRNVYPETQNSGFIMNYPPAWKINFLWRGTTNSHLPKIWKTTWLTSYNTTYNTASNLYHPDGGPIDTNFSLSFTETKALTREDILSLDALEDSGSS